MILQNTIEQSLIPLANNLCAVWPDENWQHWHKYNTENSLKFVSKDRSRVPTAGIALFDKLYDSVCHSCLFELNTLDVFPDYELYAAGMQMMTPGGFLRPHTDSQVHPNTGWYRKLSTILFLSECKGGHLCLKDSEGSESVVVPMKGRIVTFDSSVEHWVTEVTEGRRLALSMFWWSLTGEGTDTQASFKKE